MAGFGFAHWNVIPSTQIRCSTTPSLRASAIRARFKPRRFATPSAQRFKLENRVVRVSITLAASYSAVRTDLSPGSSNAAAKIPLPRLVFLGDQSE